MTTTVKLDQLPAELQPYFNKDNIPCDYKPDEVQKIFQGDQFSTTPKDLEQILIYLTHNGATSLAIRKFAKAMDDAGVCYGDNCAVLKQSQSYIKGDFINNLNADFGNIDKDENGYLTEQELRASKGGMYGLDIDTLITLLQDIEDLENDEWGPENDGITKADISALAFIDESQTYNELFVQMTRKHLCR